MTFSFTFPCMRLNESAMALCTSATFYATVIASICRSCLQ
jgi:hypothetical protein